MRYFQNVDTGNVIAMEDEPQGEWLEIEQEEFESLAHPLSRPTKRALDSATPCPDCGSRKLGIHSINCSRYRPPSQ